MSERVYFLKASCTRGMIKIGASSDVPQRLRNYMQWSPVPLEIVLTIPGGKNLESALHNCFADDHSHAEWFFPSERLISAISKLLEGTPVEEAVDLSDIRGNVRGKVAEASRIAAGNPTSLESRRANKARRMAEAPAPEAKP